MIEKKSPHKIDHDDGWDKPEGWPVVAAGSPIFFVYLGLIYSYGIVQLHLNRANLASMSTLSFVGSVSAAMSPLAGMLVARLFRRIGYRATSIMGSVFSGLGEYTAGWSTKSVTAIFLTQGVLFGTEAALLFLPAATVPSLWFKRKRVGGLETALKVLGASAWIICIPASYFLKAPPGRVPTLPFFVPPFVLPLYVASIGISGQMGAVILAAWNFASAVGRTGTGFGADAFFGPVNNLLISLTLIGITTLPCWPFASTLGLLVFFAILNVIGSGGVFSLMPVVTGAVSANEELADILMPYRGVPVAGYSLDAYGGSDPGQNAARPAMFYAGSLTLESAGMVLTIRLTEARKLFARI
ncbi:hypothetical protein BDZ85DRAFT_276287 [Elsinoe ampelina]|uniref:Major facilitator superfamily domain-containing protein n=1 Tax=Elsinoe ampelina TaxID=302913 RepID=A0A6A6G274_9PEZI|nr:hypothetical protein BDZ85DRAFT_276287 [Elsinoe ampelina]